MTVPASLKRLIGIWILVWPLVTLGLFGLQALVPELPTVLKTFILTALLVPMISLVIGPFVTRRMAGG